MFSTITYVLVKIFLGYSDEFLAITFCVPAKDGAACPACLKWANMNRTAAASVRSSHAYNMQFTFRFMVVRIYTTWRLFLQPSKVVTTMARINVTSENKIVHYFLLLFDYCVLELYNVEEGKNILWSEKEEGEKNV